MSLERSARPLARCIQCTRHNTIPIRSMSTTPSRRQDETTSEPPSSSADAPPPPPPAESEAKPVPKRKIYNPYAVNVPRTERRLTRFQNQMPVGSRRRRAAHASGANIPFQELPYQCFQEARKVLQEDRAEKVADIEALRAKIAKWSAEEVPPEREALKEKRIQSWSKQIEQFKILADINDPLVKKNFEDGFGDMSKPIYRHLSDLKWRSHKRMVLMQRIEQMKVVPDVLPAIDPKVSTKLSFGKTNVPHGDFVLAQTSEKPPRLEIQSYEKGRKLVSIAVVTPDVPNVEKDGFDYRCHFLAVNVPISPTKPIVDLSKLSRETQVVQPWLPPYSQKGAPYQRLAVVILEQPSSVPASTEVAQNASEATSSDLVESENADVKHTLAEASSEQASSAEMSSAEASSTEPPAPAPDTIGAAAGEAAKPAPNTETPPSESMTPYTPVPERLNPLAIKDDARYSRRENFILLSFATKYRLKAIGVDLFRAQWDETTGRIMRKHKIVGSDVEFKRKRVDPLPYQRLKGSRFR